MSLQVVHPRCAGAGVHKRTVVYLMTPDERKTHTFGRTTRKSLALAVSFTEAAMAAGHGKHTILGAQNHRLARRIGGNKATFAVAHSIPTISYCLLRDKGIHRDLGPTYRDERARDSVQHNLVKRLQQHDSEVTTTDRRVA